MKTIQIDDEVWRKLNEMKMDGEYSNMNLLMRKVLKMKVRK